MAFSPRMENKLSPLKYMGQAGKHGLDAVHLVLTLRLSAACLEAAGA